MNIRFLLLLSILFSCSVAKAQWVQTSPCSGPISCLAMQDSFLFAGTTDGKIFRTSDNGISWLNIDEGLLQNNVLFLTVWGDCLFAGYGNFALCRSTNNGLSWTHLNMGVNSLAISGNNLYAASDYGGAFLSVDSGASWIQINNGLPYDYNGHSYNVSKLVVSGVNLFAVVYNSDNKGVYLSTDSGKHWNKFGFDGLQVYALQAFGNNVFIGTSGGAYRSVNNGTNSTRSSIGLPQNTYLNSFASLDGVVFAGTSHGDVFRSNDSGATWIAAGTGLSIYPISSLAVSGGNLFAGGGSVYHSIDNGENWTQVSTWLTNIYINSLAVNEKTLYAGALDGVFSSTDRGKNWVAPSVNLIINYGYSLAISGTNLYAGSRGGIFKSKDSGKSWVKIDNDLDNKWVNCLAISNSYIFAGTEGGVFRSSDSGSHWSQETIDLVKKTIYSLLISGTNLFAGCSDGIYLSSDSGKNWTQVLTSSYIQALAFSGSNLFAAPHNSGVLRSSDNGGTWVAANNGLTSQNIRSFTVSGKNLFAGSSGSGVFLSKDSGLTWTSQSNGIENSIVNSVVATDSDLFAGTQYWGIWRRPLSEMISTSAVTSNSLPSNFSLEQNYPNPFSQSTSIRFDIPERTAVTLKVFDITGRLVATVADETLDAGSYSRTFNAEGIPGGTYICRLEAGGFRQSRMIVVLP